MNIRACSVRLRLVHCKKRLSAKNVKGKQISTLSIYWTKGQSFNTRVCVLKDGRIVLKVRLTVPKYQIQWLVVDMQQMHLYYCKCAYLVHNLSTVQKNDTKMIIDIKDGTKNTKKGTVCGFFESLNH